MEMVFMARQEQLRNSFLSVLIFVIAGCNQPVQKDVAPSVYINADSGNWKEEGPILYFNGSTFSGFQFKLYPNKDTAFLHPFVNGKLHGLVQEWFFGKQL